MTVLARSLDITKPKVMFEVVQVGFLLNDYIYGYFEILYMVLFTNDLAANDFEKKTHSKAY